MSFHVLLSIAHVVGLVALCFVSPIQLLSMYQNLSTFWPVREFLAEIHTSKVDLWGVFTVSKNQSTKKTLIAETTPEQPENIHPFRETPGDIKCCCWHGVSWNIYVWDEETRDEVNGEVEEITHCAHETCGCIKVNEDSYLRRREPKQRVHLSRKSKDNDTNWQQKQRDFKNEGSSMHVDSCIGINYAHMFIQVFQISSHIVGIFALVLRVVNSIVVAVTMKSISDMYANSLLRFTLRKRVFWGVVFTPPVGCSRPPSAVNDPNATKQNDFVTAIRLRFSPKFSKQRVVPFDHKPLFDSSFWLSVNSQEDHRDSCHYHQVEEELDAGLHCLYFQ